MSLLVGEGTSPKTWQGCALPSGALGRCLRHSSCLSGGGKWWWHMSEGGRLVCTLACKGVVFGRSTSVPSTLCPWSSVMFGVIPTQSLSRLL